MSWYCQRDTANEMWLGPSGADANKCTGCLMVSSPMTVSPREPLYAEPEHKEVLWHEKGKESLLLGLLWALSVKWGTRKEICHLKWFNYLVHLLIITYEETQGMLCGFPWKSVRRATHLIAITIAVLGAHEHGQFYSWAEKENKNQAK